MAMNAEAAKRWGELLRQLREEAGMSQRCACRESGVNRSTLRTIELGQGLLSIDHIECLLAAYGFELEVFKVPSATELQPSG